MRLVTRDGIERLRQASPTAALAAERGITLQPLGADLLIGRCPRHGGPGRSLIVERTGRFRCLTCELRGGDGIGLVMQLDHLGFLAAVTKLADRAGRDWGELMSTPKRRDDTPLWALTPPPWNVRALDGGVPCR